MKNKEKIRILTEALEILKEDAEKAIDETWDRDNEGFLAQIDLIDITLALVK